MPIRARLRLVGRGVIATGKMRRLLPAGESFIAALANGGGQRKPKVEISCNSPDLVHETVVAVSGTSAHGDAGYLNSEQAAALLQVCVRTLSNLRRRRVVPFIKLGRLIRYRRDALTAALNVHSTAIDSLAGERTSGSEIASRMKKWSKGWPRIYPRKYPTGRIKFIVDLGKNGPKDRDRHPYDTLKEAEDFAAQARAAREEQGRLPFALPALVQGQAVSFYQFMQSNGLGDFDDVRRHYETDVIPFRHAPPLAEIVQRMLVEMEIAKGDRDNSIKTVKGIASEFVSFIGGNRKITEVRSEEVFDFVFRPGREISIRTKKNRRAVVSQIFNFALRNDWTTKNLGNRLALPKVTHRKKRILTVEECQALLTRADEFGLLGFCVAVLLCGVRTEEAQKILWSFVHEDDSSIEIPDWAAKIGIGRDVPISSAAAAWLARCRERDGQFVDMDMFQKAFDDWRDAAGIKEWPPNGLRRTFASCHFAMYGNAKETARIIGHIGGERTLFRYYIVYVKKDIAKQFFEIIPSACHEEVAA